MHRLRCFSLLIVILTSFSSELKSQPILGQDISTQSIPVAINFDAPIHFFKGPDSTYWFTN
jgi:hypothetical protein